MAIILPPKITEDTTEDAWNLSVEFSNNELDSRVSTLESRIATAKSSAIALPDTATTLEVLAILRDL